MKKLTFSLLFVFVIFSVTKAQVSINADGASANPKAMLDVKSNSKGLLIPRMTTAERTTLFNSLTDDEIGMLVFDTDVKFFFVYLGTTLQAAKLNEGVMSKLEDQDGDTKIEVEKTADDDIIYFTTRDTNFFKMKSGRLEVLNTGNSVFIGENAGLNDDLTNNMNVFIGDISGEDNTEGQANTGVGRGTLNKNTTGGGNSAFGVSALFNNTTGIFNTAVGTYSLYTSETSQYCTAIGYRSCYNTISAGANVGIGSYSLYSNKSSDNLVAVGDSALYLIGSVTSLGHYGESNTAIGASSLRYNRNGYSNTSLGYMSLYYVTGNNNIGIGANAGDNLTDGDNNIIIGTNLDAPNATASNQLYIGGGIYGNLSTGDIGIGTTAPAGKLHVYESTGDVSSIIESASGAAYQQLRASGNAIATIESANDVASLHIKSGTGVNSNVAYYSGGNIGAYAGYNVAQDAFYIYKGGNVFFKNGGILPDGNKTRNLGVSLTAAWNNIYCDDLIEQGSAAFSDRSVTDEILLFPPIAKKEGDFDYMTEKGLEELNPDFLPPALQEDNGILIGEMTTYNYKANYEQQVQIEELKKLVEQLISENKSLQKKVKRIERRTRSKR